MSTGAAIHVTGLTKSYAAGAVAVGDLDLTVERGQVYGFVGRNGAGKTTTMRMLVGLIRPTAGTGAVLGRPLGDPAALARVGSLIEGPSFYPHLSGRDNLRLLARYLGLPDTEVDAALERVELAHRAGDRFRAYSLGMKQRLGVAAALLGDPELLILDEPTNGLDPAGIVAMRELIGSLAAADRTVLLSSHQLNEVEEICDRIAVIHNGRLIAEGTVADIRSAGGTGSLLIRADPLDKASAVVAALPQVTSVAEVGGALAVQTDPANAAAVNRALALADIDVLELRVVRQSLEDAFLDITHDNGPVPTGDQLEAR
ncbi:ATP-binding cassette domain-containing protein [Catellatospora coxensis]|uniref:ABC transporter ATP-binding protein n=1 Tax=Catellatospora coxensis TaxID=310354 RepID=A0A8J3KLD4_9ACTN|nr:ATP-binding cassette domain-containing protein [Catellatospora coxensis]GIG05097.1 ABC transporter ATP-binding protein [Catellatospora coxensis]